MVTVESMEKLAADVAAKPGQPIEFERARLRLFVLIMAGKKAEAAECARYMLTVER